MAIDGLDEVEQAKLEELVEGLHRLIGAVGVGSSSTSMLVGAALGDAERRLGYLESHSSGSISKEHEDQKKAQGFVVGYLVQREVNLTSTERAQFGSFLERPFFTKNDFGRLNEFYGSAYDRLSERGRPELSFRIWEGIRQDEYQFTDLPENVREEEMNRLVAALSDPEKMPESLKRIPGEKRETFIGAMKSGRKDEAAEIINDESFSPYVSTAKELAENSATREMLSRDERDGEKAEQVYSAEAKKKGIRPLELSSGVSSENALEH